MIWKLISKFYFDKKAFSEKKKDFFVLQKTG